MPAMVYAAENALESEVKNYFLLLGMGGLCGAVPGAAIGLLISFFRGFDFGLVSLCAFLGFIFMYSLFLLLFFSFLMLFRLLKGVTLSLPSKISLTGRGEIGENTCNASLGYWDKVVMALIQGLVIFNGNPKIYFADGDQS